MFQQIFIPTRILGSKNHREVSVLDCITYQPPRTRIMRWLGEIGPNLPADVQARLRADFYVSKGPLVTGAVNTTVVALVAYYRSGNVIFAALAMADVMLLALRLMLLKRVTAPSDPVFATGLLWACLQGGTIILVVASSDMAMSFFILASGFAAIGGIIGRNFAAPRYAMTQVLVIDLSYKITFSILHPEFLPLILVQSGVFFLMNQAVMRQHRLASIQAITAERESRRQSVTDPLTSLVNRRGLEETFDALSKAGVERTLFYLDLDGFKQVNDRLGHAAGDMLLREVGRRLRDVVEPDGVACRLGGDEFLILTGALDAGAASALGAGMIAAIAKPYDIEPGVLANVGVSLGAVMGGSGQGLGELMMRADRALYVAKASGKGRCILHCDADASMPQAA